jgi:1-deoxy-D-xylulose-5-phosphate synthase
MTEIALNAARMLVPEGIGARVVDALFVKPVDRAQVIDAIGRGAPIVTIEDGTLRGGFGEEVNSVLLEYNEPFRYMPRVMNMGWPDEFIPHGGRNELMRDYGLDAESVAARIRDLVRGGYARGNGNVG